MLTGAQLFPAVVVFFVHETICWKHLIIYHFIITIILLHRAREQDEEEEEECALDFEKAQAQLSSCRYTPIKYVLYCCCCSEVRSEQAHKPEVGR